ncbi:hypothetical protein [Algoriphagus confluentis]|uniref:hypothetical protein n=1 Tax=Algoriphagus confluentis TaxID=1697556 RepID=UPI0030C67FD9
MNAESGSRPVGPSQPLALVLNRLEYSLTFAYRVKSKLLTGPIFGEAYSLVTVDFPGWRGEKWGTVPFFSLLINNSNLEAER